jgi:Ca2+-binding RTX toxin-like protein
VVFGGAGVGSSGNLNLSALNGTNGFKLSGVAAYDRSARWGGGNDVLKGGTDNDRLFGQGGNDAMDGGQGNYDHCKGGEGKGRGEIVS